MLYSLLASGVADCFLVTDLSECSFWKLVGLFLWFSGISYQCALEWLFFHSCACPWVSACNVKTRFSPVDDSLFLFYFSGDSPSLLFFVLFCSLFLELLLFGYLIPWIYLLINKKIFSPMLSLFEVFLFVCFLFFVCLLVFASTFWEIYFLSLVQVWDLGEETEAQALGAKFKQA